MDPMVLFGGGGGSSVASETNEEDGDIRETHESRDWPVFLTLTAAKLVRVVGAVHVVVALLVLPDALAVGTGELVWRTAHLKRKTTSAASSWPLTEGSRSSKTHRLSSHSNPPSRRKEEPELCCREDLSGADLSPSHLFSSERSWQLISPLQRRLRSIHCRLSHWNSALEQTGQSSSSLLSSHSAKPSQRQARGMQSTSPDRQENCSGEQVGGSAEDRQAVRGRGWGSGGGGAWL